MYQNDVIFNVCKAPFAFQPFKKSLHFTTLVIQSSSVTIREAREIVLEVLIIFYLWIPGTRRSTRSITETNGSRVITTGKGNIRSIV